MQTIDVQEAETHLAELVQAAANGEPFSIAIAGKPMVNVTAIKPSPRPPMRFGTLAGKGVLPPDFDRFLEDEIARMFGVDH